MTKRDLKVHVPLRIFFQLFTNHPCWTFTSLFKVFISHSVIYYMHIGELSVKPWGMNLVNRAGRFLFYKGFILFSFVGDQYQTSYKPDIESRNLWCLYAKNCWNINTLKMLQILFVCYSSLLCEINFFGFIKALGSKGIFCTLKEVLRQPHNALTLQVSLSPPDK